MEHVTSLGGWAFEKHGPYPDMPRKLKTYQMSQGFLRSCVSRTVHEGRAGGFGRQQQSLHQGFANEADDEDIIAATMKKPGVVLQRPVGASEAFREHSELSALESLRSPAPKIKTS